jgi:modulator of FtsH protease HflC
MMMNQSSYIRAAAGVAVLLVAWLSAFTLSETDLAIVTLFGRPMRTVGDAGLHVKWPFESVLRFDRRLMVYDPGSSEFLTRDKKNLVIGSAVCWRIVDPNKFLQTVGDATGAEMRLHDLVWATLAASIGRIDLAELLSVEPGRARVQALGDQVRNGATVDTERRFGIAVVDLQLKRINFPEQNKYAVYARMRAERDRIAKEYRAQGEEMALKIRAEADRQRTELLAEAYRDAEKLKGQGDAEAARIYGQAYGRNPQFYKFLRTLESYKKILNEKTSIILSGDSELLRLLTQGKVPDAR